MLNAGKQTPSDLVLNSADWTVGMNIKLRYDSKMIRSVLCKSALPAWIHTQSLLVALDSEGNEIPGVFPAGK